MPVSGEQGTPAAAAATYTETSPILDGIIADDPAYAQAILIAEFRHSQKE